MQFLYQFPQLLYHCYSFHLYIQLSFCMVNGIKVAALLLPPAYKKSCLTLLTCVVDMMANTFCFTVISIVYYLPADY